MISGSSVTSFATTVAVNCNPVEAPTTTVPAGRPQGMQPDRRARKRQCHGGEQRAEQPRQRQMGVARGEAAGDAGGKRPRHRERGGEAFGMGRSGSVHRVGRQRSRVKA